jgi:hypothetical protein
VGTQRGGVTTPASDARTHKYATDRITASRCDGEGKRLCETASVASTDPDLVAATGVLAGGAILAAIFAARQVWVTHKQARLDRTLQLHRDFNTGEVEEAKRRLTTLLWRTGEDSSQQRNVCYQPTFNEFFPAASDIAGGRLSVYPSFIIGHEDSRPLDDLLTTLRCVERIRAATKSDAVVGEFFDDLFGYDLIWWSRLLVRITYDVNTGEGATPLIVALHDLAAEVSRRSPLRGGDLTRIARNFSLVDATEPPVD